MTAVVVVDRGLDEVRRELERAILANDDEKRPLWEEYRALMAQQRLLVRHGEADPDRQMLLKAHCLRSPLFFCRTFGVVVEPRKNKRAGGGSVVDFIPYPHQEWCAQHMLDVLRAPDDPARLSRADLPAVMWPREGADAGPLDDHHTVIFPKTRDMGLTWMALHLIVWHWLFEPGFSAILGSRNEDEVDRVAGAQNDQTLMGRVEIILANLPPYLLPVGYDGRDHAQRQVRYLRNPENGNLLHGQPSSPHFGHGNRSRLALLDEFDRWPDAESVFDGTHDTVDARWLLTTPFEKGLQMAKRVIDHNWARAVEVNYWLHPQKDRAWLEDQERTRSDEGLSSQVHISWEGSKELRIYPEWEHVQQGAYPYRPDWPIYGAIDFGRADGTGIVWVQRDPATLRHRIIAAHYSAGHTIDWYFPFFGKDAASGVHIYSDDDLALIQKVKPWARAGIIWYGDPAGHQLQQGANLSVIQQLAQAGVYVQTNERIRSHDMRQHMTKMVLRTCEADRESIRPLDESMKNYRRPKPRGGTRPQKLAVHNWASHLATAFEYYAVNVPASERREAPVSERHVAAWEKRA